MTASLIERGARQWNPVKELKAKESCDCRTSTTRNVESGEGIERYKIKIDNVEAEVMWNPVKELKVPKLLEEALEIHHGCGIR